MKWTLRPASRFREFQRDWDQLNAGRGAHPLLDSGFVVPLLEHFGSTRTRLAIGGGSGGPGAALLEPSRAAVWRTFQPSQAPLGLIILGSEGRAVEQARDLLRNLPGYALALSVLQQDPDFSAVPREEGPMAASLDYIQTGRLTTTGCFEEYWKSRGKNLVHNLSRQRRRLGDKGMALELAADRDPAQVADAVRWYGELEARSWKASGGTAVTPDSAQERFYRTVLEYFCARGEGVIYRLLLDGRVVAVDLCVERAGMLVILKTTYDEAVEGLSLGLLLHQEIFKAAFDEKQLKVIEFYGRVRDWHTKWTNEIRTMYHLTIYRHLWVPVVERKLRAWSGGAS